MQIPSVLRDIQRVYAADRAGGALPDAAPPAPSLPARRFDTVALSPAGERFAAALRAAQAAPEVREERVDDVRAQIAAERYRSAADQIAATLLKGEAL